MKKNDGTIAITRLHQKVFLSVAVLCWAAQFAVVVFDSGGLHLDWGFATYQVVVWLLPAIFLAISFLYVGKAYRGWLGRLFVGVLWAVMAMLLYSIFELLTGLWYSRYLSNHNMANVPSGWQTFGGEWAAMIATVAVYTGLMLWLRKRKA